MYLGSNLQYLRKCNNGMTQEKLAQRMRVSRQTVSKWESGEAYPEIGNLMELCEIFRCSLDDLLRKDMTIRPLSNVQIVNIPAFQIAQYIIISTHAKADVLEYMDRWATENGLLDNSGHINVKIHWAFPYVSAEQRNRFGLQGHGAAYLITDATALQNSKIEVVQQKESSYAMVQVSAASADDLAGSDKLFPLILEYLAENGIKKAMKEGSLPYFEREYQNDGIWHKEVFIQCDHIPNAKTYHLK